MEEVKGSGGYPSHANGACAPDTCQACALSHCLPSAGVILAEAGDLSCHVWFFVFTLCRAVLSKRSVCWHLMHLYQCRVSPVPLHLTLGSLAEPGAQLGCLARELQRPPPASTSSALGWQVRATAPRVLHGRGGPDSGPLY